MTASALPSRALFDLGRQILETQAERVEHSFERAPLDVDPAVLQMRDVRVVGVRAGSQLCLRDLRPAAQLAQSRAEGELAGVGVYGLFDVHDGSKKTWHEAQVLGRMAGPKIVPPRSWSCRGRGSESRGLPAQWSPYKGFRGGLPARHLLAAPPTQGGTEMTTTLNVPAPIVTHLRGGLYVALCEVVNEIDDRAAVSGRERHPEPVIEALGRLDGIRALLDLIGWRIPDVEVSVEIDLGPHGRVLVDALAGLLDIERGLFDLDAGLASAGQSERARRAIGEIEGFLAEGGLSVLDGDD